LIRKDRVFTQAGLVPRSCIGRWNAIQPQLSLSGHGGWCIGTCLARNGRAMLPGMTARASNMRRRSTIYLLLQSRSDQTPASPASGGPLFAAPRCGLDVFLRVFNRPKGEEKIHARKVCDFAERYLVYWIRPSQRSLRSRELAFGPSRSKCTQTAAGAVGRELP
jgi:hypothetical protein